MPFFFCSSPKHSINVIFRKSYLKSVLEQTFRDFEIIIIDNFSTDNTRKIIENNKSRKKLAIKDLKMKVLLEHAKSWHKTFQR